VRPRFIFLGDHQEKKKRAAARRRRSPATVFGGFCGGEAADGVPRSATITVASSVASPSSSIGGYWRMEAATVRRLRREITLSLGSARGNEEGEEVR
jgi:hypothetical protein